MTDGYIPLGSPYMAKKVFGDSKDTESAEFLLKQILNINTKTIKVLTDEELNIKQNDPQSIKLLVTDEDDNEILVTIRIDD